MRMEVQEEMEVITEITRLGEFDEQNFHSTCESSIEPYWRSGSVLHDRKTLMDFEQTLRRYVGWMKVSHCMS